MIPLACRRDSWAQCFIPRWPTSFTIEALQPLAWLILSCVSPQGYLSMGWKLTPGILWQRMMPGVHPTSSVYLLCSGCDLKQGKETQLEMLGPRQEAGLQEQLNTGKTMAPLLYSTLRFTFVSHSSPNL